MKSLYQMERNRSKASERYSQKDSELRDQISKLEKQRSDLKYPHLLDYLKKFGKVCLPKIPGAVNFVTYGPFGLGNECSIYFHAKGKGKKEGRTLASATFTRYGDGYGLKDYSKNTGRFAKGSIGELNGMNNPTIEIAKDMTIDWFIKFARKGYRK